MYHSEDHTSTSRPNKDSVTPANVMAANSSRTSPGSAKARLAAFNADPKFKKYVIQVDKCLQTFDTAHEWADFIAFLTKLLKTFQSFPQFKEIPRKLIVAKRLSQCLNPALPTGVHQRALDVYTHILVVSGTEGLKRDIQLWSSGLFPFFEYAATSVKPTLLNLYDTYYLPLQTNLRAVMKAFILALLPGLEEETGDFFEKVFSLLDRLSGTVSPAFFLQNMWVIMIMTPTARRASLNFLSRRLPKLNGNDDISPIVGRDIGLMIRAFASALEDNDILVRRSMLDLLEQILPLDCPSLKRASTADRRLLMNAAVNVVLRRDLSLNRRLFAWLLGSGTEDEQAIFFRLNGLELLRDTMRGDMLVSRPDSRPFKVFISLLDKWEIGGPLVDLLLYDAFQSLKKAIIESPDGNSEMLLAANSLYDSVEPLLVWKQFFSIVRREFLGSDPSGCGSMSMVQFVLDRFRTQEDEVKDMHLPILFSAYLELLMETSSLGNNVALWPSFDGALRTLSVICEHMSNVGLNRPFPPNTAGEFPSPYIRACEFYEVPLAENENRITFNSHRSNVPIITSFEDLTCLSMVFVNALTKSSSTQNHLENMFITTLDLLSNLAKRFDTVTSISWDPETWTNTILTLFQSKTSFVMVDSVVSSLVILSSSKLLQPRCDLDTRTIMIKITSKLSEFLRPDYSLHHVRVVHLLWTIENISKHNHLESLFAQTLTSGDSRNAFEAFGVFWRLTDEALLPAFKFKLPLLIILDALRDPDPELRRQGEMWMRCSMKSYIRILEPLIFDLLDPTIVRKSSTMFYHDQSILSFQYQKNIDQNRMEHLLVTLHSVVKFGGQALGRITRNAQYRRSLSSDFVNRVDNAKTVQPDSSYMDILFEILFGFLRSEPVPELKSVMNYANIRIHSTVVDLIQALVARGDFPVPRLQLASKIIIEKLCISVHEGRYDLQNKLLHLLHYTFSGLTVTQVSQDNKPGYSKTVDVPEKDILASQEAEKSIIIHPLLLPTLLDGIQKTAGCSILQHWLDFILMTVPQFPRILSYTVVPLSDCICRQLWVIVNTLTDTVRDMVSSVRANVTDTEVVMLLNTLERLVTLGLTKGNELHIQEKEDEATIEKTNQESSGGSGGILGIMTNVFTSDTFANTPEEVLSIQSPSYRILHETTRILYALWAITSQETLPKQESLSFFSTRVKPRVRKVFERFFHSQSMEVIESVVDCWHKKLQESPSAVAFNIVDALASSAQTAVHVLCEAVSVRMSNVDKGKRSVVNPNITETIILGFLEEYFLRLEGPIAIQVWNRFMSLTKEVLNNVQAYNAQLFPVLRCMTVLSDKVTQTTAIEDRKLRRELQDTYFKLVDNCVLIAGRSFDQGTWLRRNARDTLVVNGRSSPMTAALSDSTTEDKGSASYEPSVHLANVDIPDQVIAYLTSHVISNLRRFLMDNDKVVTICTNIVYYVVNPAIKAKTGRVLQLDANIFELLSQLTTVSVAAKAWKGPILDVFNENRFFNFPPDYGGKWVPLMGAFLSSDKSAIPEMLAKIPSVGSNNIFSNRETETLSRVINLRRLSYALFTGEKNRFLTQLPSIQEKLVDILRNQNPPAMESEVYLCLRVLLCRLSPHNMSSFWPVVLTELLRIFDQVMSEPPPDNSDELKAVLSASKFLDLVFTLQTEEFQIHQWMFITDTVDAVYRPDSWTSEALFDQLAEMISDLPKAKNAEALPLNILPPTPYDKATSAISVVESTIKPLRKPLLSSVDQIQSIRDLLPFFSHISIASYEAMYHCMGNIDWAAVENSLLQDLFDTTQ